MIELVPAIDIIDGQCVRLTKGDYDQKTVYRDSPAEVAKEFETLGFQRLHVVDLDGAKSKHIVNDAVLKSITTATSLVVDFGGGIKTDEDIEKAFSSGASMVTVGSIAVTQPERAPWENQHQRLERRLLRGSSAVSEEIHRCGSEDSPLYGNFQRRDTRRTSHRPV